MPLTVLLGGARSGKSALAVRLAKRWAGPVVFVATADARDAEMAERIEQHRQARPDGWTTVEEPLDLGAAFERASDDAFVVLDCVSLWVANALEAGWNSEAIERAGRESAGHLVGRSAPAVVVSNEVGLGLVPVTALGRTYRDVLGRVNAAFAEAADEAHLVVAGRALELRAPPA